LQQKNQNLKKDEKNQKTVTSTMVDLPVAQKNDDKEYQQWLIQMHDKKKQNNKIKQKAVNEKELEIIKSIDEKRATNEEKEAELQRKKEQQRRNAPNYNSKYQRAPKESGLN